MSFCILPQKYSGFSRGRFCILSDLERHFKGIPRPDDPLDQNFVRRLWNLLFRRDISSEKAQVLTRIWGRIGLTVALVRLYLSGAFESALQAEGTK
ncbi:MAG: hypothetical protein Ct9H90mP23_1310 [Methanobacteriota archaeon]|nr:MAG: hypothetical protein Ct9H90mP23_1310 [Euryarchaeota archaeon]